MLPMTALNSDPRLSIFDQNAGFDCSFTVGFDSNIGMQSQINPMNTFGFQNTGNLPNLNQYPFTNDGTFNQKNHSSDKESINLAQMGISQLPFEMKVSETESYILTKSVGHGSFGIVLLGYPVDQPVVRIAVKRVLQDTRYKNRENDILSSLSHQNVVRLINSFYSEVKINSPNGIESRIYLNLVLEYIPETIYTVIKNYHKNRLHVPILLVKLYIYQLMRSLAYIHSRNICHRDIKPQNLLVDPDTAIVKLCDFGSAKVLRHNEPNISYICSRYYRAPELLLSANSYSTAVDIWSAGCVMAEMLLGKPLFIGDTSIKQIVAIINILGVPTPEEVHAMNPQYPLSNFPTVFHYEWKDIFRSAVPPEAIDLISQILQYDPRKRPTAMQAMAHPFFDEIRTYAKASYLLPSKKPFPSIMNFTPEEIEQAKAYGILDRLLGRHLK